MVACYPASSDEAEVLPKFRGCLRRLDSQCMVQGQFLVGSVCFSLYYLGQVIAEAKHKAPQALADWQPPQWTWRQSPDGIVATSVRNLQVGDTIVIHVGEMIPVAGLVAKGIAWVRVPPRAHEPPDEKCTANVKVSTGHAVECATIVLIGVVDVTITAVP